MHTDSRSNSCGQQISGYHSEIAPSTPSFNPQKTYPSQTHASNLSCLSCAEQVSNLSNLSNSMNSHNLTNNIKAKSPSQHSVSPHQASLKKSDTNLIDLGYATVHSSDKVKINRMVKIRTRNSVSLSSDNKDKFVNINVSHSSEYKDNFVEIKDESKPSKQIINKNNHNKKPLSISQQILTGVYNDNNCNNMVPSPPINAGDVNLTQKYKKAAAVNVKVKSNNRATALKVLSLNNIAESEDEYSLERKCLKENGYIKTKKVCDTLQGELFEAMTLDGNQTVVIKKTDKTLHNKRISIQQGMSIVVEENIIKEAIVLHHLTVDNKPTSDYIAKFIRFFEGDTAFYLVMEKAGNTNLEDFSKQAHVYIQQKKLKLKEWKKIVKYLFWQCAVIVYWLHHDMNCCHLDLNMQNIVLLNGNFIAKSDGTVTIDPNIKIKLVDFGLAEVFKAEQELNSGLSDSLNKVAEHKSYDSESYTEPDDEYEGNDFKCTKHGITDKHYLSAPRVFSEEAYDARKADMWSLGIILYQIATGLEPYKQHDTNDKQYYKVKHQKLVELITIQERTKYVNQKMVNLMCALLNVRENERYSCCDVVQHEWLNLYYSKYKVQIKKKSQTQIARNKKLQRKMGIFPYYKTSD